MFSLIILFFLLLSCSAFFSGSETALFSLSDIQLHKFSESKGKSAQLLTDLLREPRRLLVTILLGNELVNIAMSIVGAAIISRIYQGDSIERCFAAVIIVTPIILLFGEITPKSASLRIAESLAQVVIWPLSVFYKLVTPLRIMLAWIADHVVAMFGGNPDQDSPMVMEKEFLKLVDMGQKHGAIVAEESEIIHNVFEFSDKIAKEIMTTADRLFMISIDKSYDEIIEEVKCTQYSRIPFYSDNRENIIGILHVKDLFELHRKRKMSQDADFREILHCPLFISELTPLEDLLKEFKRTQMHMAIIRDGASTIVGMVTLDDVLEELFGEIE